MNSTRKPVAVVVGATSKWQSDGRNTQLVHGKAIDDSELPIGVRWGVGGAISLKFAKEGFFVVLTTRNAANAAGLGEAIRDLGGESMIVELDLVSRDSISKAFAQIRDRLATRTSWSITQGIWRGATFRRKRNFWNTFPSKCSKPRSTYPAAAPSWS